MVNDQFDIRATILPTLINGCYQQQGRLSKGLRKKYEHLVQPEAYDWIESCVKDVFFSEDGEAPRLGEPDIGQSATPDGMRRAP